MVTYINIVPKFRSLGTELCCFQEHLCDSNVLLCARHEEMRVELLCIVNSNLLRHSLPLFDIVIVNLGTNHKLYTVLLSVFL